MPTLKISSNSELFRRKPAWIDFDAGKILDGESADGLSTELFRYILRVADGTQRTCNEIMGYKEIALFKDGVIL